MKKIFLSILGLVTVMLSSCSAQPKNSGVYAIALKPKAHQAMAAFAAGCFWCTEHVFDKVDGVDSVIVGYAGGHTVNPTYEQVCTETTGHAESFMVYYNPKKVTYNQLLDVFFLSQDPTTVNQQGPDRGSSYRSIIFVQNEAQRKLASAVLKQYDQSKRWKNPIVTEILDLKAFYRAEQYHQNYVKNHPFNPYVRGVSKPRFERFKNIYKGVPLKK